MRFKNLTTNELQIFLELSNKQYLSRLGKHSSLTSKEYKKLCTLTKKNIKK